MVAKRAITIDDARVPPFSSSIMAPPLSPPPSPPLSIPTSLPPFNSPFHTSAWPAGPYHQLVPLLLQKILLSFLVSQSFL